MTKVTNPLWIPLLGTLLGGPRLIRTKSGFQEKAPGAMQPGPEAGQRRTQHPTAVPGIGGGRVYWVPGTASGPGVAPMLIIVSRQTSSVNRRPHMPALCQAPRHLGMMGGPEDTDKRPQIETEPSGSLEPRAPCRRPGGRTATGIKPHRHPGDRGGRVNQVPETEARLQQLIITHSSTSNGKGWNRFMPASH